MNVFSMRFKPKAMRKDPHEASRNVKGPAFDPKDPSTYGVGEDGREVSSYEQRHRLRMGGFDPNEVMGFADPSAAWNQQLPQSRPEIAQYNQQWSQMHDQRMQALRQNGQMASAMGRRGGMVPPHLMQEVPGMPQRPGGPQQIGGGTSQDAQRKKQQGFDSIFQTTWEPWGS
jgi:hypothetical protein